MPPANPSKDLRTRPRTDVEVKQRLQRFFAVMSENESGIGAAADPEFLHRYRVSVRRTRSMLAQFRGIFPQRPVRRFRRDFAWLGGLTGPARDLDVYLLRFNDDLAHLPAEKEFVFEPLRELLGQERTHAHAMLARGMQSARYRRLMDAWSAFLASPVPARTRLTDAMRPVSAVADERIRHMLRRARRQGRKLRKESPAEAFHTFRKTCKKLRYLIEFFQDLYPSRATKHAIKTMTRLQDVLGALQDVEVQRDMLRDFQTRLLADSSVPAETPDAIEEWIGSLQSQKEKLRVKCVKRFADFDQPKMRARFSALVSQ